MNLMQSEPTFDFLRAGGEDKLNCGVRRKTLIWVEEKEKKCSPKHKGYNIFKFSNIMVNSSFFNRKICSWKFLNSPHTSVLKCKCYPMRPRFRREYDCCHDLGNLQKESVFCSNISDTLIRSTDVFWAARSHNVLMSMCNASFSVMDWQPHSQLHVFCHFRECETKKEIR